MQIVLALRVTVGYSYITPTEGEQKMSQFAKDLVEMMNAWNVIIDAARTQNPSATEEEICQIAHSAMKHSLKIA